MFTCSECDRDFSQYDTPGKCPVCGEWAKLQCGSCGGESSAKKCIDEGGKCPKCGKRIAIPGKTNLIPVVLALLLLLGAGIWLVRSIQTFFMQQP